MSRFFVQLLLSVVVGVSMAVGFAPNAVKIRQEVMASLRERVKVDLPFVGGVTTQGTTGVKANTFVSALFQFKSVIKENFKILLRSNFYMVILFGHHVCVVLEFSSVNDFTGRGFKPQTIGYLPF